jgi:hypothetical protein
LVSIFGSLPLRLFDRTRACWKLELIWPLQLDLWTSLFALTQAVLPLPSAPQILSLPWLPWTLLSTSPASETTRCIVDFPLVLQSTDCLQGVGDGDCCKCRLTLLAPFTHEAQSCAVCYKMSDHHCFMYFFCGFSNCEFLLYWVFQNKPIAGGVAQVIQFLPSKCETLSSNPSADICIKINIIFK